MLWGNPISVNGDDGVVMPTEVSVSSGFLGCVVCSYRLKHIKQSIRDAFLPFSFTLVDHFK